MNHHALQQVGPADAAQPAGEDVSCHHQEGQHAAQPERHRTVGGRLK